MIPGDPYASLGVSPAAARAPADSHAQGSSQPCRILFDDQLVESLVFLCANRKFNRIPELQIKRFHAERERAYGALDPDERAAAFDKVHHDWFKEWRVGRELTAFLDQFPLIRRSIDVLGFRQARTPREEGSELYVNPAGLRHGMIAIRPERLTSDPAPFLHHEAMHLSDMVDPAFDYSPNLARPGQTASQLNLLRRRYALLWDIVIDGRLTQRLLPTVGTELQRRAQFESGFSFLAPSRLNELFECLWRGSHPTHLQLVGIAADPRGLETACEPVPGAQCPLCGFATFQWSDAGALPPAALRRIQTEFPAWSRAESCCHRCAEMYSQVFFETI